MVVSGWGALVTTAHHDLGECFLIHSSRMLTGLKSHPLLDILGGSSSAQRSSKLTK